MRNPFGTALIIIVLIVVGFLVYNIYFAERHYVSPGPGGTTKDGFYVAPDFQIPQNATCVEPLPGAIDFANHAPCPATANQDLARFLPFAAVGFLLLLWILFVKAANRG